MKKIRQGVFETNSSSTHSICIAKEAKFELPKAIHFDFGEFGWGYDTLRSTQEKADYLYTGLIANERFYDVEKLVRLLTSKGLVVTKEEPQYEKRSYTDKSGELIEYQSGLNTGYVDHSDELKEFLDSIFIDADRILRYLFSDLSFIITGNDNDGHDVEIRVDYPYDGYYKGN